MTWAGNHRGAVSLTYDDNLPVHHEVVAPLLASKGITGTFYLSGGSGLTQSVDVWRKVAGLGHELGNHSLFHACRREPPERYGWLAPTYDLCQYTPQRWRDEIRIMNCLLQQIDGRAERTFGKPCGHATIGPAGSETRLDELILAMFPASRGGGQQDIITSGHIDFANLNSVGGDGKTFEQLRPWIEKAEQQGGWLILTMHGVGAGVPHGLFIETDQHAALVDYLAANRERIWSASVLDVVKRLKT
ncbi:MAG: hypothetical protein PCFJNLEI_00573 [Verrucomicrobiae bacterium]|nr:hypothetical protein [Verrucomicrobiae bacterium]